MAKRRQPSTTAEQQAAVDAVKELMVERWQQVCAAQADLLVAIRSYADLDGPVVDCAPNVATTICFLFGCTAATARTLAAQAGIIDAPGVADAFASGAVNADHLSVLARRGATGKNLDRARQVDAEDLAIELRKQPPPDEGDRKPKMGWNMRNLPDGGDLVGSFRFHASEGDRIRQSIDREMNDDPVNPATGVHDPLSERMAQAVLSIFGHAIAQDADPDRATVSIFVDHATERELAAATGYLADGTHISNVTLQRLLCDCRLEAQVISAQGEPLRFSMIHRHPHPAQTRAIRRRQGGICAWPGCRRGHFIHAHHLTHWARGGPTVLANLVGLCSYHHRLVHEGRWSMTGTPDHLVINNPNGVRWRPPWMGLGQDDDDDEPLRFNPDQDPRLVPA